MWSSLCVYKFSYNFSKCGFIKLADDSINRLYLCSQILSYTDIIIHTIDISYIDIKWTHGLPSEEESTCSTIPLLAVLGGEGTVQFLYDAARGQLRVHGAQVRRARRGEHLAPERVFGEGKVPRQGSRSRPHVVGLGAFHTRRESPIMQGAREA